MKIVVVFVEARFVHVHCKLQFVMHTRFVTLHKTNTVDETNLY